VISDTELRDIRTHCSHDSRNLMTKHRRRWNDIVSSKKQVGVTQPGGLHVDQDFASHRRGYIHILEVEPTAKCVEYERLHLWPPYSCPQTDLMFRAAARRTPGWRFAGFEVRRFSGIGLACVFFFLRFASVNLTKNI
jgi:hypothetical protein